MKLSRSFVYLFSWDCDFLYSFLRNENWCNNFGRGLTLESRLLLRNIILQTAVSVKSLINVQQCKQTLVVSVTKMRLREMVSSKTWEKIDFELFRLTCVQNFDRLWKSRDKKVLTGWIFLARYNFPGEVCLYDEKIIIKLSVLISCFLLAPSWQSELAQLMWLNEHTSHRDWQCYWILFFIF